MFRCSPIPNLVRETGEPDAAHSSSIPAGDEERASLERAVPMELLLLIKMPGCAFAHMIYAISPTV